MAGSSESGGAAGDPYASSKATLRETIKWLAGIFGALAAVVIGGTPLSGLGAMSPSDTPFWLAGLALLAAFVCICLALVLTLRLLRADLLYLSDIDPAVPVAGRSNAKELQVLRKDVQEHRIDLYPEYASLQELFSTLAEAEEAADQLAAERARLDAASPRDAAAVEAAKKQYDEQIAAIQGFRDLQQEILAYASYQRFYGRLRGATPVLFGLGIGALVCLMVFTVLVKAPKDDKAPPVVVIPVITVPPVAPPPPTEPPASQTDAGAVHFALGSAVLGKEGLASIEQARNALLKQPESVLLLMARTDTVGNTKINDSLARQRAAAVRNRLVTVGGIAPSRVFLAELPKNDLPKVTADGENNPANRVVSMHLLVFRR